MPWFADDAILAFETYYDAKRVFDVLGTRFARFELRLHPDKTRFVDFRFTRPDGKQHPETDGTTFTFLGFCHVLGQVPKGQERGAAGNGQKRHARALAAVTKWCRNNRHTSVRAQHAYLSAMMRGHYAYYGRSGNYRRLSWYAMAVARIWRKWLSRRDRQGVMYWRHVLA